jgi:hypothetical protein
LRRLATGLARDDGHQTPGHDGARAATQQHRDPEVTASSLAPWGQSEDEKRVFTDFLKDAKRCRELVSWDWQAHRERELWRRHGYDGAGPPMAPMRTVMAPPTTVLAHPTAMLAHSMSTRLECSLNFIYLGSIDMEDHS